MTDRLADDFDFIRKRMVELAAPVIVRIDSLMPVSRVPLVADTTRYPVRIVYRFLNNLEFGARYMVPAGSVGSLKMKHSDPWHYADTGRVIPETSVKRLTLEQIDRWNALRSHTGMRMEIIP